MRKLLLSLACLIPFAAHAQQIDVQTVPYGDQGKEAWLIQSDNAPIIIAKLAFSGAGSSSDTTALHGRATMAAALLNEGAGTLSSLAFKEALESHAIRLSFGVDDDQLIVELETLKENADKAFELMSLALTKPTFAPADVARVKAQMLTSLRQMQEQPRYIASRTLAKAVYGEHPYAWPTEGTVEGINAITQTQLKDYQKRHVTAGNLRLSVVGDISAPELKMLLDTHLSAFPREFSPKSKTPEFVWKAKADDIVVARPIPQTVTLFASEGIARGDEDFYIAYVLNHLLGGGTLTSKLGDEIREKRGLAYYAYTGLQVMDHGALFAGGFGTRNEQSAAAMDVMRDTLTQAAAGEISQEEVDEAKGYIIGAWPLSLASNDGLAGMLQVMQRFNLGKDYLKERNTLIGAVTREDVLRVAKRLVQPDKLVLVSVGAPVREAKQIDEKPVVSPLKEEKPAELPTVTGAEEEPPAPATEAEETKAPTEPAEAPNDTVTE